MMGKNVAQIVTDKILNRMEEAETTGETFHWVKPFAVGAPDRAYSYETMKAYTGINRLLLDNTEHLTIRMLNELNRNEDGVHYQIRKGTRSNIVCFYTEKTYIDEETGEPLIDETTGKELKKKIIRYTPVFSREDIVRTDNGETLPSKFDVQRFDHDEINEHMRAALDRFNRLFNYFCKKYDITVEIVQDGTQAYFSHDKKIRVPAMNNFKSVYDWVTANAHEMAHATGMLLGRFGGTLPLSEAKQSYAREELIAEITAEIIANELQIIDDSDTPDNAVAYIHGWSSFLKDRPSEILRASAAAEKAAQLILETLREMELEEQQAKENTEDKEMSDDER